MRSRPLARFASQLAGAVCLLGVACGGDEARVDPVEVTPADDTDGVLDTIPPRDDTGPGASHGGGIWIEDAQGQAAGVLVRRGSEDSVADKALYDFVTVFHPDSGLFFEVTMSDGVVRYPNNTLFQDFACNAPIGVSSGACVDCRSGFGTAFLHGGRWWRVRGGVAFETMGPGSSRSSGLSTNCVAHGTSNARAFPVDEVSGATPPTSFLPPLRYVWR